MSKHLLSSFRKSQATDTTCESSFRPPETLCYKTLRQPINKATAHLLVQEMLKKRREQRELTSRNNSKNLKPTAISTLDSCEVQSDSMSSEFKRIQNTLRLNSNRGSINSDICGDNQMFKKSLMSLKPTNVFDRLYLGSQYKSIEEPMSVCGVSSRFKENRTRTEEKVEDRLLEYRRRSFAKLGEKRAQLHAQELSLLKASPQILNYKMQQSSPYGSLLERFEVLEKERQRNRVQRSIEIIREELSHMRDSPHINKKSKELTRGVEKLLNWESLRKIKLEMRKKQKVKAEVINILESTSRNHIAPRSYLYLRKITRKSIEDLPSHHEKSILKLKKHPCPSKAVIIKNNTRNDRLCEIPLAINTQETDNYIASKTRFGSITKVQTLNPSRSGGGNLGRQTNRRANSIVINM